MGCGPTSQTSSEVFQGPLTELQCHLVFQGRPGDGLQPESVQLVPAQSPAAVRDCGQTEPGLSQLCQGETRLLLQAETGRCACFDHWLLPVQAKVTTELSQVLDEEERRWMESLHIEEYQITLATTVIQVHPCYHGYHSE